MKIYSYQSPYGNFGDDLNEWIWPRLFPGIKNSRAADWLIGIGTILDKRLLQLNGSKLICGTGYRPGTWQPTLQEDWNIAFVRGPLTAAAYGLPDHLAITDPALLIAHCWTPQSHSTDKVGFIPHYHTARSMECDEASLQAGVTLIDPRRDVEYVLKEIASMDRVIVEAMHGAIAADSLNVPWVRVNLFSWIKETPKVSNFKWTDWANTVGVDATPLIQPYLPYRRGRGGRYLNPLLSYWRTNNLRKSLLKARDCDKYQLSSSGVRQRLLETMLERITSCNICPNGEPVQ